MWEPHSLWAFARLLLTIYFLGDLVKMVSRLPEL